MKYLFWLAVGLLVWWAWRRVKATGRAGSQPSGGTPPPQDMVTCAHCGIHLPRDEAVAGIRGQYCGAAHRSAAGDHNPA